MLDHVFTKTLGKPRFPICTSAIVRWIGHNRPTASNFVLDDCIDKARALRSPAKFISCFLDSPT